MALQSVAAPWAVFARPASDRSAVAASGQTVAVLSVGAAWASEYTQSAEVSWARESGQLVAAPQGDL